MQTEHTKNALNNTKKHIKKHKNTQRTTEKHKQIQT